MEANWFDLAAPRSILTDIQSELAIGEAGLRAATLPDETSGRRIDFSFLCRLFVSSTYTPLPVWVWESIYLFSIINTVLFFTSTKVLSSFTVHDSHTFETIKYNVVVVSKEREYWTYRWRRVRHRASGCWHVCRRVFIEQNEQQQTKRKTLSFPDLGGATVSSSLLWQSNNP